MADRHVTTKQPLSKTEITGEERGISIANCRAIRCTVLAPKGQTFNSEVTAQFFMRHAVSGRVLPINFATTDLAPKNFLYGCVTATDGLTVGYDGVVMCEAPVHGEVGDEVFALVSAGALGGDALDPDEQGSVFIIMERLGER